MSEQVLQALFEELKIVSGEERTRLKQLHYFSLYGSSSNLARQANKVQLSKYWKTYKKQKKSMLTVGDNYD